MYKLFYNLKKNGKVGWTFRVDRWWERRGGEGTLGKKVEVKVAKSGITFDPMKMQREVGLLWWVSV